MKNAVLIKKFQTWTDAFDPEYLDEVSELKAEADRIHMAKKGLEYVPRPWEGLEYLDKEQLGNVFVGGFLWSDVAKKTKTGWKTPEQFDNQERKNRIIKAWEKHAADFKKLGATHHRVLFSLSKEFHQTLVRSGINPDEVLKSMVVKSMKNYQDKFHPGDAIGFCYGLHHDTDNLHAHVFVHPRTINGEYVSFSSQLKAKQHSNGQSDHLGFLKRAADNQVKQWLVRVNQLTGKEKQAHSPEGSRPRVNPAQWLRSDRIFYAPPLGKKVRAVDHQYATLKNQKTKIQEIDKEIAVVRSQIKQRMAGRALNKIFRGRSAFGRLLSGMARDIEFNRLRQLQQERYTLRQKYMAGHRKLYGQRPAKGTAFTLSGKPVSGHPVAGPGKHLKSTTHIRHEHTKQTNSLSKTKHGIHKAGTVARLVRRVFSREI